MAWAAGAQIVGSMAGGLLGGDDAPKPLPHKEANANYRVNNPSRYTPFGSVEYRIDDMGTPEYKDDQYYMVQQYSPEMQGLMDAMLGIAGAAPSSFQSSMPEGVRSRMEGVFGSSVPGPQYSAPDFAFGYDGGSVQPAETEVDSGGRLSDYSLEAGSTTNQDLVSQAYQLGNISLEDYNWFQRLFSDTPEGFGSGGSTAWASADSVDDLINRIGGVNPQNRRRLENLFYSIPFGVAEPDPQTEPNKREYSTPAMNKLLEALV